MTTKHAELPDGITERNPDWHFRKFTEFTQRKMEVNEPSPHLAMVGHMSKDESVIERVWRIGCYAIPYSLPVGMMTWQTFTAEQAMRNPKKVLNWIDKNWNGILKGTRRERRCVRSVVKYKECVASYINWMQDDFPALTFLVPSHVTPEDYYDMVWDSVQKVKFFGRYIGIRVVEGLRRFADLPAQLYDIRSMGAWSPRKCLVYLFPKQHKELLTENAVNNRKTDELAWSLAEQVQEALPGMSHYVYAAMLCEYRDAFEDRRQYAGWTIDQEPLLFQKSYEYFGDSLDSTLFWNTRADIFPTETLGEFQGWEGTRWDITNVLRDYGYVWSDLLYDYVATRDGGSFEHPVERAQ